MNPSSGERELIAPAPWSAVAAIRRSRQSVRGKLMGMMLLTTAIALLVAGVAMLAHDLAVYRTSRASDLAIEAGILAFSTAPAVAFHDRGVAERNLSALRAHGDILVAAVYDSAGNVYAQFSARRGEPVPATLPDLSSGTRVVGESIEVTHPIEHNDERLGTVYLRARYDVSGRITTYVGIFALVTLLSMLVAFSLSAALQSVLTVPLQSIASVARRVVEERNYSLRATETTNDEIGIVVQAFNNMMSEVQARTRALEETNSSLRDEIAHRQATEAALARSEKLYRAIGESINYGVWVTDPQGRTLYLSDSFLRLTGRTLEQCSGLGWTQIMHPDEIEGMMTAWAECRRTGSNWYREYRVRAADGTYYPLLAQGVPMRDEDGTITGWAGINLDISRMKQTEEALRDADRRKDEFLATLAHELRNPLAPIRHATRILDMPSATEQQRQWGREVIARQVQHMALLLDDLLDVSRITRGRLELRMDIVSLRSLIATAVETARPLIDARRHTLDIQLPEEVPDLNVDPLRISQSLSNLLTNAAKYTDPGGRITITARVTDEGVTIAVTDTGIGLTEAAMSKVFEMFSQVESAIDRSQGGLGIGLALVKGLISLHGGSVSAASAGPGRGSTFTIRLPARIVVTQAAASTISEPTQAPAGPHSRILVADDNRDAAESLALLLRIAGHEVFVAHSGSEAVQIASREQPAVLILDIGMPDLSGYEVAQQLRVQPWARDRLFIALTGWGQREDKDRAQSAGFDLHFTKPVDGSELERQLNEFTRRRPRTTTARPA